MADLTYLQTAFPVLITDETNSVLVTPASTAAVATSAALTIAISPNSPLPAGTNVMGIVSTKSPLTAASPASVSVGVTSGTALASNASRRSAVFTNLSTATISFGIGAAAVLNSGITLTPNGVWVMDEFTFATGAINAIASGASSTLSVQEFT